MIWKLIIMSHSDRKELESPQEYYGPVNETSYEEQTIKKAFITRSLENCKSLKLMIK